MGTCHGLTQQLATRTRQPLIHPSLSPPVRSGGEWKKRKTYGLRERQFSTTTKEILLLLKMQNILYTIWFSHDPVTDLQPVPEQRSLKPQLTNFRMLPKNTELLEKLKLPEKKKDSRKKGFLTPGQPLFINWAWHPWHGIFPLASLGQLPGCAPSQLLHTWSLAERNKRILDFLAATKTISGSNILRVLNPKHSSYWEEY